MVEAGQAYGETYWTEENNGRSLSMYLHSVSTGAITNPMQLEYTVQTDNRTLFYDVSNFDGKPFAEYGFNIWTTDPVGFQAHCPAVSASAMKLDWSLLTRSTAACK